MLDGFPITEPDGRTSFDLPDLGTLSKVRVVRSNASALFGSASGGLVDLVSNTEFERPFYEARGSGGSFGFGRLQMNSGFLARDARIRASLSATENDGWRENSEADQLNLQGSATMDPSDRTSLGFFLWGTRNRFEIPGALTREEFNTNPRQANPAYVERHERRDHRLGRVGARLRQRMGEASYLFLTGYLEPKKLQRSERNRFRDFQRVHTGGSLTGSFPLPEFKSVVSRWNIGVEDAFQDGSILFYTLGPDGSRGDELVADTREANNNLGVFTEFDVTAAARWNLTAGARWDFLKYVAEDHIDPQLNAEKTLDHVSPRISLAYAFRERMSVYAALSGGIEGPAFNEVDPPAPYDTLSTLNPFLEPAESLTYEIGTKGRLPIGASGGDELGFDVALYTLMVENDIIPWDGGAFYFMAGETRRSGIELGLTVDTDVGLSARTSASFSDNEYIDYVRDDIRFDGNEAAGIPSTFVQGTVRYDYSPVGAYIEGKARYVGEYFADDANSPEAKVPFFTAFDLTVGANRIIGGQRIGAFVSVDNLTDENYVSSVFINGADGRYFEPGMERNYLFGLTIGGDFGK